MTSDDNESSAEELDYNQRWEGYLAILLASLVNFASVADITVGDVFTIKFQKEKILAIFGAISFILSLLVLVFDRISYLHRRYDLKAAWDGKLEGYMLLFLVIWWIVGVGIMTRADGIAYRVLNTYFSSWYALIMSVLTMNNWSSEKDIISIHELTRLSKTLPYWYALLLSSLVEMGSAADVLATLQRRGDKSATKAKYAVIVGAVTVPVALFAILIHYRIIICFKIKQGGMTEIFGALLLCVWWIVAVSLLTADGAVASTIQVKIALKWKAAQAMGVVAPKTAEAMEENGLRSSK